MNEHNNNTIGNFSSSYQTLGSYFNGSRLLASPPDVQCAPTPAQNNMGNVIVPVFGGVAYSSPSEEVADSGEEVGAVMMTTNRAGKNYYTITSAYPNYPNSCGLVTSNLLMG